MRIAAKTCYQISSEAFDAILTFGTDKWKEALLG